MKLLTIVGARPQFIKAAMVSRAIAARNCTGAKYPAKAGTPELIEEIIHTGQHYDDNMSDIFFRQMGIPHPAANLTIGSGSHGAMTGRMLEAIEREITQRRPDKVLVYGDTNSTLAGALAAAKLRVPVAHVEAGLRSFNKAMPEEINRILTDHVAALLFCPTRAAVANLAHEGITHGVHHVGDVMQDAALFFGEIAGRESTILRKLELTPKNYLLATVHRAENTDDPARLRAIMQALGELAGESIVVFPVHPRTAKKFEALEIHTPPGLRLIPPVSFLDMIALEKNARVILTDSGGVQKEAYFHGVPCVTLRAETEWVETVEAGWNQIAGADPERIVESARAATTGRAIDEYGDGRTAEKIIQIILSS